MRNIYFFIICILISLLFLFQLLKIRQYKNKSIQASEQLYLISQSIEGYSDIYENQFLDFPEDIYYITDTGYIKHDIVMESMMIYIPELNCMSCLQNQLSQLLHKDEGVQFNKRTYILTRTENLNQIIIFAEEFRIPTDRILVIDSDLNFLKDESSIFMFTVSYNRRIENVMKIDQGLISYNIKYYNNWDRAVN